MISALYTSKDSDLDGFADNADCIYIGPKWRVDAVKALRPSWIYFAVEDIGKRDTWLRINNLVSEESHLVLDRVSRYYAVSSETSRRLARLTANVDHVQLLDIVPFCEDVEFLYMPWRYVDRGILGYAHYYAFRENYAEQLPDGRIVQAHDFSYLAGKLAPYATVKRCCAVHKREIVQTKTTTEEQAAYMERKEELFNKYTTAQPIITRLADFSNALESRRAVIVDLAASLLGKIVIVCNIQKFATEIRRRIGKHVIAATYESGPDVFAEASAVIYAEPPIIQSFRLFDIEASLSKDCAVYRIVGDTKVDQYLDAKLSQEIGQVDGFIRALKGACDASL